MADRAFSSRRGAVLAALLAVSSVLGCSLQPGEKRSLDFPADRSLGELAVIEAQATYGSGPTRLVRGQARGRVTVAVPQGWLLELRVGRDGASSLAALADLGPAAIDALSLDGLPVGDDDLEHLSGHTGLRRLDLGATRITGSGLGELRDLDSLDTLSLAMTGIDDDALEAVAALPALAHLNLARTRITDFGVATIASLRLESLSLNGTAVTDDGVAELADMTTLRALDLGATRVTDDGLGWLSGLTELRRLVLDGTRIDDRGLHHLRPLTALQHLSLDDTKITEAGARSLEGLKCAIESNRIDKRRLFPECF